MLYTPYIPVDIVWMIYTLLQTTLPYLLSTSSAPSQALPQALTTPSPPDITKGFSSEGAGIYPSESIDYCTEERTEYFTQTSSIEMETGAKEAPKENSRH